jgi:uncharacterized FlaG/YvyC family protein
MAMQITSLSAGNTASIAAAAMQEAARQKRTGMPVEQKVDITQAQTALLGAQRDAFTDSAGASQQVASNLQGAAGLTFDSRLEFVLDQESSEITVKVVDNRTDEVIRVLPPEELQRLHSKIREATGSLLNREV